MTKKFGTKRDTSNLAAYSLQAGMNLKTLEMLAKKVGEPFTPEEMTQIKEVRRTLRKQYSRAVWF